MLTANKTALSSEASIGDLYELKIMFGAFSIQKVGEISVWSVFGVPVFERVGSLSVLFGVNWND